MSQSTVKTTEVTALTLTQSKAGQEKAVNIDFEWEAYYLQCQPCKPANHKCFVKLASAWNIYGVC